MIKVVIVGHVDHGKSTVLGRLLADTNSLPKGKLERIKNTCKKNAKPFEYAFLLDALKDEQDQGITLNIARSFAIVLFPLEVCPIKKLYFFISIFADFIAPKSVTIKCAMLIKKFKLYPSYKRITIGKCSH